MDRFRTIVKIPDVPFRIGYQSSCLLTGSCFAESMGERMERIKLPVRYNPFGVLYNPASVSKSLRCMMEGRKFASTDLKMHQGLWISLDHHSSFSHPDRDICLARMNKSLLEAEEFLRNAKYLFITFGTAWTYLYNKTDEIVANCHKLPADAFHRRLLDAGEIVRDYGQLIDELSTFNPNLQLIFTISPIRHMKDGPFQNQVSKSVLFLAIHSLMKNSTRIHYFPAYEIFMDELRDYRFYAADMVHPSEQGIDYIWERLHKAWFDESARNTMKEVDKIRKALSHRPLQAGTINHKSFVEKTMQQINRLQKDYPFLDFTAEQERLMNN